MLHISIISQFLSHFPLLAFRSILLNVKSGEKFRFDPDYKPSPLLYLLCRYFVHPLTYPNDFNNRNVFLMCFAAYLVPMVYGIITEIMIGRVYHETILFCHLPGTRYLNYVQFLGFFGPSLIVTIYSMVKIWRLSMALQISPAGEASATVSNAAKARLAFKAIALVSGNFWGSYIPSFFLRTGLFSVGYTWYDMDTRRYLWPSIGVRLSQLLLTQVSAALNPFIYFYTNRKLRVAIRKTMGWIQAQEDKQEEGMVTTTTNA